jgi:hypothetical protein
MLSGGLSDYLISDLSGIAFAFGHFGPRHPRLPRVSFRE